MLNVQARGDKVDVFMTIVSEDKAINLRARPVTFEVGKRSTDPELALMTLTAKEARELGNKLLRATNNA